MQISPCLCWRGIRCLHTGLWSRSLEVLPTRVLWQPSSSWCSWSPDSRATRPRFVEGKADAAVFLFMSPLSILTVRLLGKGVDFSRLSCHKSLPSLEGLCAGATSEKRHTQCLLCFLFWWKTWKFTREKLLIRAERAVCAQRQPERSRDGRGGRGKTKMMS